MALVCKQSNYRMTCVSNDGLSSNQWHEAKDVELRCYDAIVQTTVCTICPAYVGWASAQVLVTATTGTKTLD